MAGLSEESEVLLMDEDGMSLANAIWHLRSELRQAMEDGRENDLRFDVDSIEVELELELKVAKKLEGKASFWTVITTGGSRENTNAATHRLRLVLTPRVKTPGGKHEGVRIADQSVRIPDDS